MAILLTTPYESYGEVDLIEVRWRFNGKKQIFAFFQYGDTVGGNWIPGDIILTEKLIRNIEQIVDGETELRAADPVYDTFETAALGLISDGAGYEIVTGIRRTICQHAIDEGWFAGTIQ